MIVFKHRMYLVFGLVVALAVVSLGCGLTARLAPGRAGDDAAEVETLPTRTPWPTFTSTPEREAALVPTSTPIPTTLPTDTPTPLPPTDTPTPVAPVASDTPPPPPTNPPAPQPQPTNPPAPPPATPTPAFPFSPLAWEGQWNGGLAQIRGKVTDPGGNPVNGVWVQAKCGGTVLASNPSGINLYAPGEPYEAGAYDIVLSSPLSGDSMCNWEVRVVEAANFDEAKSLEAPALSPIGYCDLAWEEMSICFANWRKN